MVEQFENNYITQLNGGIDDSVTTITVDTAPTNMTGNFRIRIDSELILVGSVSGTDFTGCTRGIEGTTAISHIDDSEVRHVLTAESLQGGFITGKTFPIVATFDGGTSIITGNPFVDVVCPSSGNIISYTLLADVAGDAELDIWKDTYANFPPDVSDSITASAPPTLSSESKSQDSTLTGWDTDLNAGDILRIVVDSSSIVKKLELIILYERD